jgi:hypothetical protein
MPHGLVFQKTHTVLDFISFTSAAEPHHFDAAPATGRWNYVEAFPSSTSYLMQISKVIDFDAAPTPAPQHHGVYAP